MAHLVSVSLPHSSRMDRDGATGRRRRWDDLSVGAPSLTPRGTVLAASYRRAIALTKGRHESARQDVYLRHVVTRCTLLLPAVLSPEHIVISSVSPVFYRVPRCPHASIGHKARLVCILRKGYRWISNLPNGRERCDVSRGQQARFDSSVAAELCGYRSGAIDQLSICARCCLRKR
jgi:hypothetical protein